MASVDPVCTFNSKQKVLEILLDYSDLDKLHFFFCLNQHIVYAHSAVFLLY